MIQNLKESIPAACKRQRAASLMVLNQPQKN